MNNASSVTITVGLGDRSYPIEAGPNILPRIGDLCQSAGFHSPIAIVTDDIVAPLYADRVKASITAAGFSCDTIVVPSGETHKNLATVSQIYDRLLEMRVERKSGIVALGGGVIGDMAGFAAASFLRGVPFIQVPTTLLAQVDASVGGKVGVDHAQGKNLIGAFYQPQAVVIDTQTLKTLPERQIRAGLGEIIKHGVIQDEELFAKVKNDWRKMMAVEDGIYEEVVPWNCRIKAKVVEQDEKESGIRAILNFGHTIGHAIESLTGYETYLHGEAVAIGMLAETMLGHRLGITPDETVSQLHDLVKTVGYPLERPDISAQALIDSMYLDKKVSKATLRFVLPTRIGEVVIEPLQDTQPIVAIWDEYAKL